MKSQDIFHQQKQAQLSQKDKSNIGEWDEKIVLLCNKINKNKNYYTTSSCSGRIVLLKASDKKMKNAFLFRTHDKTTFKKLKQALEKIKKDYNSLVEFQQTCCILHVASNNIENALELVKKAKLAGWKRSGVMTNEKRCVIELLSTESISFPIMNNKQILVSDEFLELIVELANSKLERVWNKIERLKKII